MISPPSAQDGFHFVDAFCAGPEVFVHFWDLGNDALVRGVEPFDVRFVGDFGARRPGGFGGSVGDGVEVGRFVVASCGHVFERQFFAGDHVGGGVDELADWGDAERADDVGCRDQRAYPVGDVDDVVDGAAREEVLVAAGHADDFVREHWPDHQVDVGFCDQLVDLHVHGPVFEEPVGQAGNFLGGHGAERGDRVRVLPIMVHDLRLREPRQRRTQQLLDRRHTHRRVRTQRNQDRDGLRAVRDGVVRRLNHQRMRARPRPIRNNYYHFLAVDVRARKLLPHKLACLLIAYRRLRPPNQRRLRSKTLGHWFSQVFCTHAF